MHSAPFTRRATFKLLAAALLVGATLTAMPAVAQDRGTRDEAKAMADAAFAHVKKVGPEQAYKDFTNDKATWTRKDLYVFAMDYQGKMIAHGANEKMVGRDLINLKDSSGKAFVAEMIAVAKKGNGWVDYEWADPLTKKVEGKSSYIRVIPSVDNFVGVGIYR